MIGADFEPKIRAYIREVNNWLTENRFQILASSEVNLILELVDQNIKANAQEESPTWELPWIITDALYMLRRMDLPIYVGGKR